ncbi:MAG TPA: hypothetical protein VES97_03270, partial [Solirubrobacteraceae bacterium]|nr:hypothetical protein [Solirubrobacteraceae bacterium]
AGTTSPLAGGFSPFTLTVSRADGQQYLSTIGAQLPPGLSDVLKSVPLCPEPQASSGGCPQASEIGTATVAAGAGALPLHLSGPVYLTGPYGGAPFGLAIVVHAIAGPFDLGTEVVRTSIAVDPTDAHLTILSSRLPTILAGVPLRLRTVNVTITRQDFMLNPTDCDPLALKGAISSTDGSVESVSYPFQVGGCAGLPFAPKISVLTRGRTSRANGAYLHLKITSGPGQTNIGKVKVRLPKQLPSRLTTLQKACPAGVFEANPASCPAGALVGTGTAATPLLKNPLAGPAYLVSHGGAAFPDLVIVLQGEGITLDLDGKTNISEGVTSSTFASLPDTPISTFDLVLSAGPHSLLAANTNLCKARLAMPAALVGQDGAVVRRTAKVAVTGCAKAKKKA